MSDSYSLVSYQNNYTRTYTRGSRKRSPTIFYSHEKLYVIFGRPRRVRLSDFFWRRSVMRMAARLPCG